MINVNHKNQSSIVQLVKHLTYFRIKTLEVMLTAFLGIGYLVNLVIYFH